MYIYHKLKFTLYLPAFECVTKTVNINKSWEAFYQEVQNSFLSSLESLNAPIILCNHCCFLCLGFYRGSVNRYDMIVALENRHVVSIKCRAFIAKWVRFLISRGWLRWTRPLHPFLVPGRSHVTELQYVFFLILSSNSIGSLTSHCELPDTCEVLKQVAVWPRWSKNSSSSKYKLTGDSQSHNVKYGQS